MRKNQTNKQLFLLTLIDLTPVTLILRNSKLV